MLDEKKVLVTGAAGFIGSYVVHALVKESFTVIVVENLSNSKIILKQNGGSFGAYSD
ncbi:NAD-dependent epimerase/dehydratase family protein [Psychrobacillus sp. OK032]|uniref:NAD-dependent epimerase/dehydratase family protein n=1 Tax=Psychrobacillus sp. OK032 TaxID=1884358 RepID=UPI000B88FBA2|nr:NAD-dependent epimerase/dehydratase family protein [Psychrobacillus sp. OK032]